MSDHALAADLATAAGELLLDLRANSGLSGKELKDAGDRRSHEFLMAEFGRLRPDDAVLSEEGRDDLVRLTRDRVWIVDPLDGTREYGEPGRTDWAVHVALWAGSELAAGAVALPAQGVTLATTESGVNFAPPDWSRYEGPTIRCAVSRSRPPGFLTELADFTKEHGWEIEQVPIGSAGAKIAAVLQGQVDAYVHAGGQYEWDNAAPAAVALAAGAHASRISGATLTYNHEHPELPDILVCHPSSARVLLAGLQHVSTSQRES
jgi:3'(2'), 5'-bisphosphate nucleotidase